MRIALAGWGSDGDLRPMFAVAGGLKRRGHAVRLVTTSVDDTDYSGLATRLKLDWEAVPVRTGLDFDRLAREAEGDARRLLEGLLDRGLLPFVSALAATAERDCGDCDVVIGHFMAWPWRAVAARVGRPFVSVVPWPGMLPSVDVPPPGFPTIPGLTGVSWSVVGAVLRWLLGSRAASIWRSVSTGSWR